MTAMTPIKPVSIKGPFAVLDVGSSKLGCLIVEPAGKGLTILSYAMHASAGIQRGQITDLALFSETVGKVVEQQPQRLRVAIPNLDPNLPVERSWISFSLEGMAHRIRPLGRHTASEFSDFRLQRFI